MKNRQNYSGASGSFTDKVALTEEGIQQSLQKNRDTKQQAASADNNNADVLQQGLQTESAVTKSQNVFASLDSAAKKS